MRILAYRFSAFGDVAMTVVVLREFLEQNPEVEVVMVSRLNFKPLFEDIPRLQFIGVNIDQYKGFFGLRRLAKELFSEFKPDAVADFHDVIRSKVLSRFFKSKKLKVSVIDKGKKDKEQLTDVWNLNKKKLKPTVERYADVLRKLDFPLQLSHHYRTSPKEKQGIGFAPFAQHKGKMLPYDKSLALAKILAQKYKIYFFGGGSKEAEILKDWENQIPNSESLANKFSLKEELEKIAGLHLMISMDSANMHLASLVGTRCISVWGATHHFAGFLGYGQSEQDIVEVRDLTCRPCSVFGDKACYRGDYACLQELDIQKIVDKIKGGFYR